MTRVQSLKPSLEEEKQFPKVVLQPPYVHQHAHTHTKIKKKKIKVNYEKKNVEYPTNNFLYWVLWGVSVHCQCGRL